ncbi:MAG: pantetheine-phosphate adenylyltransferase [Clostridia bacterium]|nr:pantetheine-phosphate adenylyltransferase [Clostridia bacterium]
MFPGSFDPPTVGHIDLIRRASALFDRVIVAVLVISAKRPLFSTEERVALLRLCVGSMGNVEICAGSGLTVDLAREMDADVLLRGVRGEADAGVEAQLAAANRHVGGIDTLALFTSPEYGFVSSSVVRDVLRYGGTLTGLVPEEIEYIVAEKQLGQS